MKVSPGKIRVKPLWHFYIFRSESMNTTTTKKMVLAAFFLALGLVLPFLTGQIPQIGRMLLPMHIPVILCGFICGPFWGLTVGAICPIFRSLLFTTPLMADAIPMAFELASYGLISGVVYKILPKKIPFIYLSLITAMVGGRVVWGMVRLIMTVGTENTFPMSAFISGAVTTAIPGIVVQLVLIPILVMAIQKHTSSKEHADV